MTSFLCLVLLAFFPLFVNGNSLLIGAFNIKVFGQSKIGKPEVVEVLVDILKRYDIVVVQEIRDAEQTAFPELVRQVNLESSDVYDFVESPRAGRTSSKEQYGFMFKRDIVRVIGQYDYPDPKDIFEREPYAVRFERVDSSGNQKIFALMALHVKPDDAVAEIDALADVYDLAVQYFNDENIILGGDFNADCNYVCSSCWSEIDLWTDQRFTWLISSDADTNVASSSCAYDRLVVAGASLTSNSGPGSVFRFDDVYKLTEEEAHDVSDHYPVEFYLD